MKKNGCMSTAIAIRHVREKGQIPVPPDLSKTEGFLEDRAVMDLLIIMD